MTDLLTLNVEELAALLKELGQGGYRAKQLNEWLMKGATFEEMTNLPKDFRRKLAENCLANPVTIARAIRSQVDETEKLLYALPDGNVVEGVLMRYHYGDTLCLSTQVGCRMGCRFCASTLGGRVRDLTAGEMLGQIVAVNRYIAPEGRRVHNVVLMGSGEPLDNYDNVVAFLRRASDPQGLGLSCRHISLSTCGLVEELKRFTEEGLPVTLSLSLHAPDDATRKKLMPVAERFAIAEVLAACRAYVQKTGRRLIVEYALVGGVNDSPAQADELARLLRGFQCHVNVIPLNAVAERELHAPEAGTVERFLRRLEEKRISATRRRTMGDDIAGACGQLRRRALNETELEPME